MILLLLIFKNAKFSLSNACLEIVNLQFITFSFGLLLLYLMLLKSNERYKYSIIPISLAYIQPVIFLNFFIVLFFELILM